MNYEKLYDIGSSLVFLVASIDFGIAYYKKRDNYKRPVLLSMLAIWLCVGGLYLWGNHRAQSLAWTICWSLVLLQGMIQSMDFKVPVKAKTEDATK